MPAAEHVNQAAIGARWCAIGLGFSLPISVAVDYVLLAAFIGLWLAGGDLSRRLYRLQENPVALAALAFAAVALAGMIWSSGSADQLRDALTAALRFILLGLFAVVFLDESTRDRAQFAFLVSSALVLLLSYALWAGVAEGLPGLAGRADYPVAFKHHATHGVLMAIAALLFAVHALEAKSRRARFILGALAAAAVFNVFFMLPGLPAQLALAAGIAYLAAARLRWPGNMAAAAVLIALGAATLIAPDSTPQPGDAGASEPTSLGMRLELYRNTLEMIGERPVIGAGSGAFQAAYEAKVRGTQVAVPDHPHSAFLQIAAELGLLGLALIVVLLQVQWRSAGTLAGCTERTAARAFLVAIIAAGLVSSTFGDHAEGWLYAWASGLLFATVRRPGKGTR